jgi:dimethylargininase
VRALTRLPGPRLAEAQLTHLARTPIDWALAARQHARYVEALRLAGLTVTVLATLPEFPDCPFVEDVLISLPELHVLCRPGAPSRRGEVEAMVSQLDDGRPLERLQAPATLDGGDVLRIGRRLLVGQSTRTSAEGLRQLEGLVARYGYTVEPVAVHGALHLKTAVTALPDGRWLLNPEWLDPTPFRGEGWLTVDEPFGANSLSVGERLLYPAGLPRTAERLAAAGFALDLIDISEFGKAEAGLTCLSVVLADAR